MASKDTSLRRVEGEAENQLKLPVLRWSNVLVIRLHSEEVSGRVDQPSEMEDSDIPGKGVEVAGVPDDGHEVGGGEVLAPEQVGNEGGQDEAGHEEALDVVAVLEHEVGVLLEVGHVDGLAGLHDGGVLPNQQPAHVGEEEASVGIVGVGHGLAALVVEPAGKYEMDG